MKSSLHDNEARDQAGNQRGDQGQDSCFDGGPSVKRTTLMLLAAGVILASCGWGVFMGIRNRQAAAGGTLELTERELRLPPVIGDSTALQLELLWRVDKPAADDRRSPVWLDAAKLSELGFDCSVPVTDSHAPTHYDAMGGAQLFVVLRLEPRDTAKPPPAVDQRENTRLVAIDVGRDPERLRQKYPSATGHILTRGVVRVWLQERDEHGQLLPKPRLAGVIEQLVPQQVFVPRPGSALLQSLRPHLDHREQGDRFREPRFAGTVRWGRQFEPWLSGVRLLTPGEGVGIGF